MTILEASKLGLIKQLVRAVKVRSKNATKAKNQIISYYTEHCYKLDDISFEAIEIHYWGNEVNRRIELLDKIDLVEKYAESLERHIYAPELNKLYFKNGRHIGVRSCETIEQACFHVAYNNSLERIQKMIKS
jgi:hypothetical protein